MAAAHTGASVGPEWCESGFISTRPVAAGLGFHVLLLQQASLMVAALTASCPSCSVRQVNKSAVGTGLRALSRVFGIYAFLEEAESHGR